MNSMRYILSSKCLNAFSLRSQSLGFTSRRETTAQSEAASCKVKDVSRVKEETQPRRRKMRSDEKTPVSCELAEAKVGLSLLVGGERLFLWSCEPFVTLLCTQSNLRNSPVRKAEREFLESHNCQAKEFQ